MTDFKIRLDAILENSAQEYRQVFDKSNGIDAMANNLNHFTHILDKFIKDLTSESNLILEKSDKVNKDELLDYGRELILKLRDLMLNPFSE